MLLVRARASVARTVFIIVSTGIPGGSETVRSYKDRPINNPSFNKASHDVLGITIQVQPMWRGIRVPAVADSRWLDQRRQLSSVAFKPS